MTLLEAAHTVLCEAGESLHYGEITKQIITQGLWPMRSQTPAHTLNALVGRDIKRRAARGEQQRFVRAGRGMIGLAADLPDGLLAQIARRNREVRAQLLKQAQDGSADDFEQLIETLLVQMGFEDVEVTSFGGDGGVDVRGTLVVGDAVRVRMAVQAKKWQGRNKVGRPIVQQVRGSLGAHEQGLIITTSDFTKGACEEAARPDATPVALMNGKQLAVLLAENEIGVRREEHVLLTLDEPDEAGG